MNFWRNLLTAGEQKILLFVAGFFLFGSVLQVSGFQVSTSANMDASDSIKVAVQADKILLIDLRLATKEELMSLSGIGPKRADDIIAYRNANPFTSVNQIMNVKGIGEKTYLKMYPNLVIFGDSLAIVKNSTAKAKSKESTQTSAPKKGEVSSTVNLNTATLEELCTLEGIGKAKATAIIEYRKANGKFTTIENFTKVKGIGQKTLEKNRHRLSVD